jgi:hypothetical protein
MQYTNSQWNNRSTRTFCRANTRSIRIGANNFRETLGSIWQLGF